MKRIKLFTILGIGTALVFLFLELKKTLPAKKQSTISYTIQDRWELPSKLQEVSGIAWLEDNKILAIQDEDGILFIYDLQKRRVEEEIKFDGAGDYEGVAVTETDAYVLRSDGIIIEISDFRDVDRTIKHYRTPFTSENNMESLEFDFGANRLLIGPKDHDLNSEGAKGIYAFSLESKQLISEPVIKIDLADKVLKRFREKNLYKTFRPSDLAIHPKTKKIYILEGAKPKLLIMDAEGNQENAYAFDNKVVPQPEGITFSPDGTLYIASEGKGRYTGTITKLKLKL